MLFNSDGFVVNIAEEIDIDDYALLIGGTIVQMVSDRPSDRHQALISGEWEVPKDAILAEKTITENEWREAELVMVGRQLEAIEEDEVDETPPDLLPGTRKQWLKYRGQVSNWNTSNEDYPDSDKRPKSPV